VARKDTEERAREEKDGETGAAAQAKVVRVSGRPLPGPVDMGGGFGVSQIWRGRLGVTQRPVDSGVPVDPSPHPNRVESLTGTVWTGAMPGRFTLPLRPAQPVRPVHVEVCRLGQTGALATSLLPAPVALPVPVRGDSGGAAATSATDSHHAPGSPGPPSAQAVPLLSALSLGPGTPGQERFYTVVGGRDGAQGVFTSWAEVQPLVHGISFVFHQRFHTRELAEEALESALLARGSALHRTFEVYHEYITGVREDEAEEAEEAGKDPPST